MSGEISPAGKPATAGSEPELRASHADRDRVVEALTVAAGDGRLTSDELDERLEAALNARTLGELAPLTADLPADLPAAAPGGVAAEVKDLVRIEQRFSAIRRTGPWVVPRRIEIDADWSEVTLDFTEAVITQSTLRIDVGMRGKNLTLIVGPGIVVDADGLQLEFSKLRHRRSAGDGAPVRLRIELVGHKTFGRVVVRQRRRSLGQWLLRKPAPLGAVGTITSR